MSTILDALRKLQRERAAAHPPRDLRGSVTDEIPAPAPPPRAGRRGLALVALAVLLLGGAGAWWLLGRGPSDSLAMAEVTPDDEDTGESAVFTPEEMAEIARREAEANARDAAMDQATAAEPTPPAPVAASPPPPPEEAAAPAPEPVPDAAAEVAAERARLEAAQAEAALAAQRQAEAEAAARAAATPPPPPPEPEAAAAPPSESPVESLAPPAPAPAPPPAPKPQAKPKPKPAPKPKVAKAPPPESRYESAEPESVVAALPSFPPVRVDSIRWHPISERRVASLRFEQQNVSDAHEGDIVGGVLVYRIDPGAVELRIGSTSRVIRPTP